MKLLILGGTRFLGRALVDEALALGYEVTLFNRGRSNPDLYPQLERLRGDRDGELDALRGRQWDVVVDTCGYVPRIVRQSAELLAGAVERYIFISSLSVHPFPMPRGTDETGEVAVLDDPTQEEITNETYGALKALCEEVVTEAMDGRALHVRAGLIVGPHDPTDRFTYWPVRLAEGGDILAPGDPDAPVQFIDVRDIARWTLASAEQGREGVFSVNGPGEPLTMGRFLQQGLQATGAPGRLIWVDEAFLLEQKVAPWTELPLWVEAEDTAFNTFSVAKALRHGLTFRPLAQTVRDTVAWAKTRGDGYEWVNGLRREREVELLDLWRGRSV